MNTNFSANQRQTWLAQLDQQQFDLLIVGGGITGAGIALDAATRGLKVALVEKCDFAWGTSSRSTKLIHGGLRYLKQLEFGLVHEVGTERAIVYHNARHVVRPEKMLLPIVQGGSLGKTLSSIGLWVYDRLAGVEKDERRQMLSKEQTLQAEPLLRQDILNAGGLYYEYRTDDARLTIELIKTAVQHGAQCFNHLSVENWQYNTQGQIQGAKLQDQLNGTTYTLRAKVIINAAGPWVDTLRQKDKDGVKGKRLQLTKGVHLVVPYFRLPLQQSVYFDVQGDKGRMCFAIPRQGITYIGTTDTTYNENIDSPQASPADIQYILQATNAMFPSAQLKPSDVLSTWAGLRPLIHQDGKSPSELSRKDEIFEAQSGLISIAGGKLTGYRKMAEKIVDLACKRLGSKASCQTKNLQLSGGDFPDDQALDQFINLRAGEAKQVQPNGQEIAALAHKYGRNIEAIIEKMYELYPSEPDTWQRQQKAELWYALEHECVCSLSDYLIRRTGRLYFERPSLEKLYPLAAQVLGQALGWTAEQRQAQEQAFLQEYHAVVQAVQNTSLGSGL
jgi:glycerol-3-phosphate dehydrogenase